MKSEHTINTNVILIINTFSVSPLFSSFHFFSLLRRLLITDTQPTSKERRPALLIQFLVLKNNQFKKVFEIDFHLSAAGIECFKCVSVNGSNPDCEDPFHNNRSVSFLEKPCLGGRKNREGLFPASACIKLHGRFSKHKPIKKVLSMVALQRLNDLL